MLAIYMGLYALAVLAANLTLDHFIPLPGYGLLSIGTIFFAAVFTLRDRINLISLKAVYVAIALALTITTIAAVLTHTPPRFIAASFGAILLGELSETAVFQRLKHRSWPVRALSSNAIGIPLDSVSFTLIAFAGTMTMPQMMEIIWADVITKFAIASVLVINLRKRRRAAALQGAAA
ncbi:VUT family protein [Neisseriaceae bacterium JH1-16]|nr:VUT family protein [Neisseriaceae bacterium JH1-16]